MIRHIPDIPRSRTPFMIPGFTWTYCGRKLLQSRCIDLRTTCVEDAECRACQRVDDARSAREYEAACRRAGVAVGEL
jgi:hypothetical protein